MKKSELRRHTPLRSKKAEKPKKAKLTGKGKSLRAVKLRPKSRKQANREKSQFGPHAEVVRGMPCELCRKPPRSSAHHTKHRKHGGRAWHLVPLCGSGTTGCHGKMHREWKDGAGRVRVMNRLERRAAEIFAASPKAHLYCSRCCEYTRGGLCGSCEIQVTEGAALAA